MKRRGTTLIETLFAIGILVILLVGILQMFFLSLHVTRNSAARTQMVYKAQQVAEAIRWLQYHYNTYGASQMPTNTGGVPIPLSQTSATLDDSDANQMAFWGPSGMNVFESTTSGQAPFRVRYEIVDNDTRTAYSTPSPVSQPQTYGVIVTLMPIQAEGNTSGSSPYAYQGSAQNKRVQYVVNIRK